MEKIWVCKCCGYEEKWVCDTVWIACPHCGKWARLYYYNRRGVDLIPDNGSASRGER